MKNWLLCITLIWIFACSSTPEFNDFYRINDQFSNISQKKAKIKAIRDLKNANGRLQYKDLLVHFHLSQAEIIQIFGANIGDEIKLNNKSYSRLALYISRDERSMLDGELSILDEIEEKIKNNFLETANNALEQRTQGTVTLDRSNNNPIILVNASLNSSKKNETFSKPQFSADGIMNLFDPDEFEELLSDADYDLDDLELSENDSDELKQNGYLSSTNTIEKSEEKKVNQEEKKPKGKK